ncbi:gamma-glutamyltransferase [candidate division KSB1 bacterium]|nr:gamma-glutamyltransferase [candidate division KSB1 bacterium]
MPKRLFSPRLSHWYSGVIVLFLLAFEIQAGFRPPVRGQAGMVVSAQALASDVGVEILKKGGNAVDAAVAVGYALAVVFPSAGNLGGGGFMVIRLPDGTTTTIDFREVAPARSHRDLYLDSSGNVIPNLSTLGYWACGVPGSVAGLNLALEKYGRLSLKTVLEPAIKLAEAGFPVDYDLHQDLVEAAPDFQKFPASAKIFLKDGLPYPEGDRFVQKDLARTLKILAQEGTAAFYRGSIADLIVKDMEKHQGLITRDDLAQYTPIERPPVRGAYRGYEIISMGPPSSGGIALIQFLNLLEPYDLRQLGFHSSRAVHLLTEAFKLVFADRAVHLGDPDFWKVPTVGLTSKAYTAQLREKINWFQATPAASIQSGAPAAYESSETTHYSVVDKNNLAVAVTTTLNLGYGSRVVIEGAGFLMNNEMDDFSARPNTPNAFGLVGNEANAIEPHKRMLSSMSPTIVVKDQKPFLILGAAGGPVIITSVAQVIIDVIDYGMQIQAAMDAPKIHHQWLPDTIFYEKYGLTYDVLENLARMGHKFTEWKGYGSQTNGIMVCPQSGVFFGGPDSRGGAVARGY